MKIKLKNKKKTRNLEKILFSNQKYDFWFITWEKQFHSIHSLQDQTAIFKDLNLGEKCLLNIKLFESIFLRQAKLNYHRWPNKFFRHTSVVLIIY